MYNTSTYHQLSSTLSASKKTRRSKTRFSRFPIEEVQTPIYMGNLHSLTPFLVKMSNFGEFRLNYGKVSRIIQYTLLHGLTDNIEFPFNESVSSIFLSFILTLDFVAAKVYLSVSKRHCHDYADQKQSTVVVKWKKAKYDVPLCCNEAEHHFSSIILGNMKCFTEAYDIEEDLTFDIEIFKSPEIESRNTFN